MFYSFLFDKRNSRIVTPLFWIKSVSTHQMPLMYPVLVMLPERKDMQIYLFPQTFWSPRDFGVVVTNWHWSLPNQDLSWPPFIHWVHFGDDFGQWIVYIFMVRKLAEQYHRNNSRLKILVPLFSSMTWGKLISLSKFSIQFRADLKTSFSSSPNTLVQGLCISPFS